MNVARVPNCWNTIHPAILSLGQQLNPIYSFIGITNFGEPDLTRDNSGKLI